MTACAIAGSGDPPAASNALSAPAANATVTWLRSASDDLEVHLHAARQIPQEASSPNLRTAAASSWSIGVKNQPGDNAPSRNVSTVTPDAQQPDLWTLLGSAQLPIGWAFVLASLGLMMAIGRRREFD